MRIPATIVGAALLAEGMGFSHAQPFPTKGMRMIVPPPPAGSADFLGRLIAENLQKRLGQTMVTENRPGAGQPIASAYVAKADPDGHTLILVTVTYATSAAIYSKLPFDPMADLTGVAMVGEGPLILTVHPSLPVKPVRDLVALARSRPGVLNYGSAGAGSIPHLATELFAGATKINVVHVP